MTPITVSQALSQLQLTRLTHFTPARNLWHIFEQGGIRSSADLAANAPDCFGPTDRQRLDQHPDRVCCSFEYPNGYYLAKARDGAEFWNYPEWVCLLLDVSLVLREDTLFSPCNAAKGNGAYIRSGGQALLDCFRSPSIPGGWPRGAQHLPGAATDLQAEVLVRGPVDLSYLRGIVVRDEAEALDLYAVLDRAGFNPGRHPWIIAPTFFDRDLLSMRVRNGKLITENCWIPPVIAED
ncbi:DarT ssDNA thymidine ADP-ribosyltransferase family protein [Nonomuraea rubra]|uniref:DarT ssDNA thymidine ADP-ribosyltransferase family protein n=1 Tax=Nonomuraea rubra TaxID=46180 RepID=UPI0034066FF7